MNSISLKGEYLYKPKIEQLFLQAYNVKDKKKAIERIRLQSKNEEAVKNL